MARVKHVDDSVVARRNSLAARRITPAEKHRRLKIVEELWYRGLPERGIKEALAAAVQEGKLEYSVGPSTLRRLIAKVRERIEAEHESNRGVWKAQAITRISREIRDATAKNQWGAVVGLERLLADIQGTREPILVDVNVRVQAVVVRVIANMSKEQMDGLLDEYDELSRYKELALATTQH